MESEWFEAWFDSPWYHQLYQHHNEEDAHGFMEKLIAYLHPSPDARILDMACGRGRHAFYLSSKGFDVTGLDISPANIAYARRMEQANLSFYQHDMRRPFRINYFDVILNIFTSFGYFDKESEHLQSLRYIANGLRPDGHFVLDFLNAEIIRENIVRDEVRDIDGISFHIHRYADEHHIYKEITFTHLGKEHRFIEKVSAFGKEDFERMFALVGLKITNVFGSYQLEPFDVSHSNRLILVASKQPHNG